MDIHNLTQQLVFDTSLGYLANSCFVKWNDCVILQGKSKEKKKQESEIKNFIAA